MTKFFDMQQWDIQRDSENLGARMQAFSGREPIAGPTAVQRESQYPRWPTDETIPEISARDLSSEKLGSAIASYGSLIVRGLFDSALCDELNPLIDRVIEAADRRSGRYERDDSPFNPPECITEVVDQEKLQNARGFHRWSGSAMCVESPSMALRLLGLYEAAGLKQIISEYLGEDACVSVMKWVIRRSKFPIDPRGWHQDGAFMGADINSINMWLPLTRCGGDTGAPGLDIIPRRINQVLRDESSIFDWSVSNEYIADRFSGSAEPVSPVFDPGDALFFDHFNLHRTQYRESFSRVRYALETWFFGSKNFPKNQFPIEW